MLRVILQPQWGNICSPLTSWPWKTTTDSFSHTSVVALSTLLKGLSYSLGTCVFHSYAVKKTTWLISMNICTMHCIYEATNQSWLLKPVLLFFLAFTRHLPRDQGLLFAYLRWNWFVGEYSQVSEIDTFMDAILCGICRDGTSHLTFTNPSGLIPFEGQQYYCSMFGGLKYSTRLG